MNIQYFQGEDIVIQKRRGDDVIQVTDDKLNEKYATGEIRIVTEQARYPLASIPSMVDSPDYIMNPDFQRRHRWSIEQKSRLMESFIMNVPIPPIFLYEVEYSTYEVMDGLQRLSAISDFYNNKFSLQGLEYWIELEGKTYNELPSLVKKGIDRRYLSSIILLKETAKNPEDAKQLKQIVFERINSGGTRLEFQESRNALYDGEFSKLCKRLSRDVYFCKIFGIPEVTEEEQRCGEPSEELQKNYMYSTMKDVEAVTRFFAMRYVDSYDMVLKSFLDLFTEQANLLNEQVRNEYEHLFRATIKLAYDIHGIEAFGRWREDKIRGWEFQSSPVMFLYDPIMYVLSQLLEQGESLIEHREEIKAAQSELFRNNEILQNGRKQSKADIKDRINLFGSFYQKFL